MTSLGIWIDDHWRTVLKDGYLAELKDLGFSTIAVMINEFRPGWFPHWGQNEIRRVCEKSIDLDMEVILTTWPIPSKTCLDVMTRFLGVACEFGVAGWEVDLEGNWRHISVRGGWTLEEASEYLVDCMLGVKWMHDIRLEMTTFPMHRENSSRAMVAPFMDRILPQAYSTRHVDGKTRQWDNAFGPGSMQRLTLERAKNVSGVVEKKVKLSCGLAAWDQKWPLRDELEAMDAAYQAALKFEPEEIRYWSSKWVIGDRKRPYPRRYFRRLGSC